MPQQDEIEQQQTLLQSYRRRLAVRLAQLAIVGAARASPEVILDIRDARDNILRIKDTLRGWGVAIENHPDDQPPAVPAQPAAASRPPGGRLRDIKIKALDRQFAALVEEHDAATGQLEHTLDAADRVRISRQISRIEQEMQQVEQSLSELEESSTG